MTRSMNIQRYLLAVIVLYLSTWNENVSEVNAFGIIFIHFFVCKKIKKAIEGSRTQDCHCHGKIKIFSIAKIDLACVSKQALCFSSDNSSCLDGSFESVIYVKKKESITNITIPMNETILKPFFVPTPTNPNVTVTGVFYPLGSLFTNFTSFPKFLQNKPNFTFSSCTAFFSPLTPCTCNICADNQSFTFDCTNKKIVDLTFTEKFSNGTTAVIGTNTINWPNQTTCIPVYVTTGANVRLDVNPFANIVV